MYMCVCVYIIHTCIHMPYQYFLARDFGFCHSRGLGDDLEGAAQGLAKTEGTLLFEGEGVGFRGV